MELKTTEEFVREAHSAACSTWKQRIEKEFPELFKTELEVNKWYKTSGGSLFFLTHFDGQKSKGYGFSSYGSYSDVRGDYGFFGYKENIISEATREEVESALIAEAKKRGYKAGVTCLFGTAKDKRQLETNDFIWKRNRLMVSCNDDSNDIIFQDGIWSEILPEEKTIITKEKALKILAKKLKVSPESIEIQ